MYDFLTGPMLWLSFAVCIIGLAARAVWYVRGLSWQLDRVPYGYHTPLAIKGALKSIFYWLTPLGSRSWRVKPGFMALFFGLHLGLVAVPLFLEGHAVILQERFGLGWPTMPAGLADGLTIAAIVAGVLILLRRFALPEVRSITTAHDLLIMLISLTPLVTGFVAAHMSGDNSAWLLAHIVSGEVMLIAIPFTKLSHVVLFFCSRAQIGIDFGTKRGGQKGRGLAW
ncbi:MAG: sulfate respiration complex protein HmcE [Thermodesulfobacteriota bacterium]